VSLEARLEPGQRIEIYRPIAFWARNSIS